MTFDFNTLVQPDLEFGKQKAYRFWRYTDHTLAVMLQSWVSNKIWLPGKVVEGTDPDVDEQGIHGFKTLDNLVWACRGTAEHLVCRAHMTLADGVVVGTVDLWGTIWDHEVGYRAQYAKPTSFMYAYGRRAEVSLERLRHQFKVD